MPSRPAGLRLWAQRRSRTFEPRRGHTIEPVSLLELLRGKVADWWIPAEVAEVSEMPLAATGKIDKDRLRELFASGALEAKQIAN